MVKCYYSFVWAILLTNGVLLAVLPKSLFTNESIGLYRNEKSGLCVCVKVHFASN